MSSENRSNEEDKFPPPNAFLAVQAQSPEIHRRLVDVAGKILDYDASLVWALEPVVKWGWNAILILSKDSQKNFLHIFISRGK